MQNDWPFVFWYFPAPQDSHRKGPASSVTVAFPRSHWRHAPPSRTRPSSHTHAAEDAAPVPFVVENAGQSVHADDPFPLAYVFFGHVSQLVCPFRF